MTSPDKARTEQALAAEQAKAVKLSTLFGVFLAVGTFVARYALAPGDGVPFAVLAAIRAGGFAGLFGGCAWYVVIRKRLW